MFTHLHRHSEYSVKDGVGTAQQYAERAAEMGQRALGISDHGTLSGALHHIKACNDASIMPVVGCEVYFKPDRSKKDTDNRNAWHLLLIAKNLAGWHSLLRITSEAYRSGFYHYPCVDFDLLSTHRDGLIASTACLKSFLATCIQLGDDKLVEDYMSFMKDTFKDDLYLELMPHDIDEQRQMNVALVNLGQQHSIPLLATVDAHYPYEDWADTQDVRLMISTGQSLAKREKKKELDEEFFELTQKSYYLMSEDEVRQSFTNYHPDLRSDIVDSCIGNTTHLLSTITPFVLDRANKLPRIDGGVDKAYNDILAWAREGLKKRDKSNDKEYQERLSYEMSVLRKHGVLDYFWIIGDTVRWAKSQGIRIGPGRGSAAGSLVSYLIGVTNVDPIAYGLLFERFLNPGRKGLPDIDIDIQDDRRDEVKDYLAEKWGEDHVSTIIAHQTFQPRAALQSVARVLDVPLEDTMIATNTIPEKSDLSLEGLRKVSERLDEYATDYPAVWTHAIRLEGQVIRPTQHAAGVVLCDRPIHEYMPVMRAKDESLVTAWSDSATYPIITEFGFLKFDFLSLDCLTRQAKALTFIEDDIDLDELPVHQDPYAVEPEVMKIFQKGLTLGIFQFESRGITNLLRQIKPDWMGDISAANALYRPGPLEGGVAFDYGKHKHGTTPEYWHPSVEPFLKDTYGLLTFQEQVMQISEVLGGFSKAEADDLRKAIGKLYRLKGTEAVDYMNQYKPKWLEGCRQNGLSKSDSEDIWKKILAFGAYGFNKSHSDSYSILAYIDAWLKTYYPRSAYASLLSEKPEKAQAALREARMLGVSFDGPDINLSERGFHLAAGKIMFGLAAVHGLGDQGLKEIFDKRPFSSFEDFETRIPAKKCNKRVKENLAKAGAFDCFGKRDEWTDEQRAEGEKEILGVALSTSEADKKLYDVIDNHIDTEDHFMMLEDGDKVTAGGEILNLKEITTKKGDPMAFMDLNHGTNYWSCTLFPKIFKDFQTVIKSKELIMVKGRKDETRNQVIVNYICTAKELADAIAEQS